MVQALQQRDVQPGPMLLAAASHVFSFLVPPGSAAAWTAWLEGTAYGRLRTVACAGRGRVLRCPRPGSVRQGRVWLVRPNGVLTDSRTLRAALEAGAPHHPANQLPDDPTG